MTSRPPDRTSRVPEGSSPSEGERSSDLDRVATFLVPLRISAEAGTWVQNLGNPHPVARLRALHSLQGEVARMIDAEVVKARARRPKPTTWAEIGKAIGLSKTAAHAHYAKKVSELESKARE